MKNNIIDRNKLSNYNALLAILVVLIHTENTSLFSFAPSALSSFVKGFEWLISKNFASIAVPSFFMISGILFYRDFSLKLYPKKLKARFFSLIIPFLLWNLFRFVLFYIFGKTGITEKFFGAPRLLFTAQNFFEGIFFYKYNLGFWFMYQLILFTILAPVIRCIVKNKWVGLFAIISLIALYSSDILGNFLIVTLKRRFILLDCTIYYIIGAYIGTHFFDIVNKKSTYIKFFAISGIIFGQLLNIVFIKTSILLFYISFLIVSAISAWYLYDYVKIKPIAKSVTSITFFIYAAHGTVLELLQVMGGYIFPDTPYFALITYIIYPIITLTVLVGTSLVIKKSAPVFWKLINGAR